MVMAIRKTLPMILMACMTLGAHAAELPTTLIVGFQAGGGLDSVARALANELNKTGKHKIVVENKPGASGMMAIDAVRNASRNSALLVIMPGGSITMTPHTNKHFQYDPQKDLVPVARLATYTLGVAVSPDVNAATLAQFLKLADNSQKLAAYGTAGIGLSPHFVGETIAKQSRVNLVHVPYKGAGPAINDALGKQIPAVISTVPSLLPMVRDGRLKLLATTGTHRDKHAPGVPTLKELGYPGLAIEEWFGILAPATMSSDAVKKWNTAINNALNSKSLHDTLTLQGFLPAPMSAGDFRDLVLHDYAMWGKALSNSGNTFSN